MYEVMTETKTHGSAHQKDYSRIFVEILLNIKKKNYLIIAIVTVVQKLKKKLYHV